MRPGVGVVALALLALSEGGCGGGRLSSATDAAGGDGSIPVDAPHPGDFIVADVDGMTVRGEFQPKAGKARVCPAG